MECQHGAQYLHLHKSFRWSERCSMVTNGKLIASSSNSGTVHVWDASTGANVLTYRGHTGAVYTVAWSPNGMRIAVEDK
jgi:WD40 repeat protein